MLQAPVKSRVHLLAARQAPVLVILQRKRAKLFHVVVIHTTTLKVSEGSWFQGKLHVLRSDVSYDGRHMVYMATGHRGVTWSGVCRLPWLTTLIDQQYVGSGGGGYFAGQRLLKAYCWGDTGAIKARTDLPFVTVAPEVRGARAAAGLEVLDSRFERDGFKRLGGNWGEMQRLASPEYQVACVGDDGWHRRVSARHPELQARYLGRIIAAGTGANTSTQVFAFKLNEYPELLSGATWATWDIGGDLWVARPGTVERYRLTDLKSGKPSFSLDLDQFEPSLKPARAPWTPVP
jgi:hypothetical protein